MALAAAGDTQRTLVVDTKCSCDDEVADDKILIPTLEVVVYPRQGKQKRRLFPHAQEVAQPEERRQYSEQEAAGLHGRYQAIWKRPPGFVLGVLDNRFREALVRELEDEDVDPDEKYHQRGSCEDEKEVWGRVGCEEGPG